MKSKDICSSWYFYLKDFLDSLLCYEQKSVEDNKVMQYYNICFLFIKCLPYDTVYLVNCLFLALLSSNTLLK